MIICLSPHFDDACFSLHAVLAAGGGHVVNIFTRSEHVADRRTQSPDTEVRTAAVTALRQAEDQRFLAAAGLDGRALGLPEPALRGQKPFDRDDLAACEPLLEAALFPLLDDLLADTGDPRSNIVYCPTGIGGHRDHVLTLGAMARYRQRNPRRFRLMLYEDLHYASDAALRRRGLARMARHFPGVQLSPSFHVLCTREEEAKMAAIGLYASQFTEAPRREQFLPASGLTKSLHEIVWRLSAV